MNPLHLTSHFFPFKIAGIVHFGLVGIFWLGGCYLTLVEKSWASLFLTPIEKEQLVDRPVTLGKSPTLKLNAILCRSDLKSWVVWINHQKITSQCPRSINGWSIIQVSQNRVLVRSDQGQEQELFLEEDFPK